MASYAKKITPATMIGTDRKAVETDTWCYRVFGRITGAEISTKNSAYGEYARLTGDFRAINFSTGEEYESAECFLPCGIGEMLAERIAANPETAIDVCFDIGMKPDNRKNTPGYNGRGYEYIIRSALPPTQEDTERTLKMLSLPLPPGVNKNNLLPKGQ